MNKYLTLQDNSANKFYRVVVEGALLIIIFGKLGTLGRTILSEFSNSEEAEKEAIKLVSTKIKKGYLEQQEYKFSEEDFWNIIEKTNQQCDGDKDYQAELITDILSLRPFDDLFQFDRIINELYSKSYRSDWWGVAYLINGGCSDDGFDYFRLYVISLGRKIFEEALDNPETLSKYLNENNFGEWEAETIHYSASYAYEQKNGEEDFNELANKNNGFQGLPEMVLDWQEEDNSLEMKFPKLFKKCASY